MTQDMTVPKSFYIREENYNGNKLMPLLNIFIQDSNL
jgi:hypothetical protein